MNEPAETAASSAVEDEVRRYYRTVSRFIDRERLGRPDRDFWRAVAREHRGGAGLDLGCGTGRVTRLLAAELAWVVGVDLSPEMLGRARLRSGRRRPPAAGRVSLT
ncbi:MAG TPA: methyltransferase domain-containing protein, partial [Thermoanaerobaculia bacterium]|nr:methyltransferase domain-containing protein [Thermoanaerobaculia bacterium]